MRISYNKLQKLMIDNQMKRQDLMRAAEYFIICCDEVE